MLKCARMRGFLRRLFLYNPRQASDVLFVTKVLHRSALTVMALLIVMTFTAANLQALLWQMSTRLVSNVLPALVVEQTNNERVERFAPPLRRNHILDEAAARKAEHMAALGYFAHYSPDGVSPWHWFDEVGYTYAFAGENLAVHFSDSAEVVSAWMQSPPQRDNILSGDYTEIGVGTAKGTFQGHETVFVVQMFGTPAIPVAAPLPRVDAPMLAEPTAVAIFSADSAPVTAMFEGVNIASTTVFASATTAPVVVAAESTSRAERGLELPAEPPVPITEYEMEAGGIALYSGMAATSSGLSPLLESSNDTAGATKTAFAARIATQPNLFITVAYAILSTIVVGMLILAMLLALRSHRPWQMVHSFLLLMLMLGLISLHFYLTTGAVVV